MTLNKQKRANRMSVLFLLCFSAAGILLLHRSKFNATDLQLIESQINSVDTLGGFGNYGRNYAIILNAEKFGNYYGLYAGTKDQALRVLNDLNIRLGQTYKLYVDPTVVSLNGYNLGIRMIENQDVVIYKENMSVQWIMGITLILMGMFSSSGLYLIAKKKFK